MIAEIYTDFLHSMDSAVQLGINRENLNQNLSLWRREERLQMADAQLDARGLKCPIPVLKARKIIKSMTGGEIFEVLATDPGSVQDFEAFCATGGHDLLEQTRKGEVFRFLIKVVEGET